MTAYRQHQRLGIVLFAASILFPVFCAGSYAGGCERDPSGTKIPAEEALALGEKMYRNGILPSGGPIQAKIQGVTAPGTTFACIGCHLRSGLGSTQEGLRTLPINGARLFQPRYPNFPILTPAEREQLLPAGLRYPPIRPAYTRETLARAIQEGVDPSGRSLNPVMPAYELSAGDMAILVTYLTNLSSLPSPGVTDTSMALATVVTDEVPPEDRRAMLDPLEQSIKMHNNLGGNSGHMGTMLFMREMGYFYRSRTLDVWLLKGPPDTWRGQLEDYYRSKPVFALVGGISTLSWEPVHRFCEDRRLPCILPLTDLPVVSLADHCTLYFSKGYFQEGEAAARHAERMLGPTGRGNVIQVVDATPDARALAAGFQETWGGMGKEQAETLTLENGTPPSAEFIANLAKRGKATALMLWTGPESYDLLKTLAALPERPPSVFMSSTRLGGGLWGLPAEARSFTYVTYPFRQPGPARVLPKMGGRPVVVDKEFRKNDRRIGSRTNTLIGILTDRLAMMERNFYRDYLIDLFDLMEDQARTDYENLSFGSGRSYGSDGCYIMQVSEGPNPSLVRKSEWALY
jgi:hypothetical protein